MTPLSFKSDDSNFVQNYFGVGSIFWRKKNWDQIDNDVTMTSFCSDEYRKLLKTTYFKITLLLLYVSLNLIETWQVYLTLILLYSQKLDLT